MKKKKVLLAIPYVFGLYYLIVNELEYMGYDVVVITNRYDLTLKEKVKKVFDKIVKRKSGGEIKANYQKDIINKYNHFDICLVVAANVFEDDIITALKDKSDILFSYQFDGIDRYEGVIEKVKYFDNFYVFDESDLNKYPKLNLKLSHNFYFKNYKLPIVEEKDKIDIYYIGSYDENRIKDIEELLVYFKANNVNSKIEIFSKKDKIKNSNINRIKEHIRYEEYLNRMNKSKLILDIKVDAHSGLSFRVVESLYYKKKVLTSNKSVKQYDFYDPQNIFILGERDMSELVDFIKSDYKEIDQSIVDKYSFESWFNEKIN